MPTKGYKQTEEHKQKLRENSPKFWKGKKRSEENKQKIREFRLGYKHSEETKKKISIAHKSKMQECQKYKRAFFAQRKIIEKLKEQLKQRPVFILKGLDDKGNYVYEPEEDME
jgi:hypothetical protein